MRLIDANKYPCRDCGITNCQSKCITYYKWLSGCDYDVEKVVEQLQQQANQYNKRALELVEKSTEAGIHNKGKACSYEHAIEIVRKGGVE